MTGAAFAGEPLADAPGWRPVLGGELAARARAVADDIVDALEREPPSPALGLQGDASIALVLAHCGRPGAAERLESALAAIAAQPATISLFAGLSGVSWLIDQLAAPDDAAELTAHFDAAVLRHLDAPRWHERYDLVGGLAGVGIYAADHPGERAARIADRVLAHLEAAAIADDAATGTGTTWRTPPALLAAERGARCPAGLVDLGVAHGVPGIIGMLARFVEAELEPERSRRLLASAVAWLLGTVPDGRPRFGASWPAEPGERKRVGWCYGDPGVAAALLAAARALGAPELEREALGLLRAAPAAVSAPTARPVPDACFCHGAAGLAHIANVAYQRTGDPAMRAAAQRWLDEVLRLREPGAGIAGYRFLKVDEAEPRWAPDATLVSGAAGVALVLLAAIEDREPAWHRLFLL